VALDISNTWTLVRPFRHDSGAAWIADLPQQLWDETDNNENPNRSSLRLLEDGRELGPASTVHAAIRSYGDGRYSFWTNVVYFSSSDGTDPNANGRTYGVRKAPRISDAATILRAIAPTLTPPEWVPPPHPLRCAVLGLGNRGKAIGRLLQRLDGVSIKWLIDSGQDRIRQFQRQVNCKDAQGGSDLVSALVDPDVDAVFITLPDHLHRVAAERAFLAGKHVFLEKPIATTTGDAKAILAAWRISGRVLQIGYVLRSAPFYQAIRNTIRQGRLGAVRVMHLSEQLSVAHGGSFMRRWHADPRLSGGMFIHKACHDLDIACWLVGSRPRMVSSMGGVATFRKAPPAPFCSQCHVRPSCPYADTGLHENRTEAERADPTAYGLDRCVFGLDKKIVDHQVASFELESGIRGTYYLAMQGPHRSERRITIIGDDARLDGVFEDNQFTVTYGDSKQEPVTWSAKGRKLGSGHGGGDAWNVIGFLNACLGRGPLPITNHSDALAGLVFAAAGEQSRLQRTTKVLRPRDFELTNSG
jgi:predicted dehydrogenase